MVLSDFSGLLACLCFISATVAQIVFESSAQQSLRTNHVNKTEMFTWAGDGPNGLFTPLESLSLLKEDQFTTMHHPFFPKYSVRIKKSDFCDPTVK